MLEDDDDDVDDVEDDWEKVELEDDRSGSVVEIIPGAGAIINGWTVVKSGKQLNIIDGYTGKGDFEKNVHMILVKGPGGIVNPMPFLSPPAQHLKA